MPKLIKVCLWAVLFTPFMVDNFAFFPFNTGENLFARGLISLVSILFLIYFLSEKKFRGSVVDKVKIVIRNPLFISILSFVFVFIVSTIFAINKYNAFWGTIERTEGMVGIMYFFSFFILSLFIFEKKDWMNFFKLGLLIAFVFVFKEIIQTLNGAGRATSFLDNPTFLAGYLLFSIFCSFTVWSEVGNKFWKYFSVCIFILSLIGIFLAQTRGTLIGLVIASVCIFIYAFIKGKDVSLGKFNLRKISIIILCSIFAFSAIFIATRKSEIWQKIPILGRVAVISGTDSTTQTRLLSDQLSLRAVNPKTNGFKKFLIGWGPENFSLAYGQYFNPKQFDYEVGWFDRSHNKLADMFVMCGLFGLLSYISIYFFFFKLILKRENFSVLNAGFIFFTVSLLVHLLFVFDQINTSIPFFAILSFTLYTICFENLIPDKGKNTKNINLNKSKEIYIGILFAILTAFLTFVFIRNDLSAYFQMRKYVLLKESGDNKNILEQINSIFEPFTPAQMNIRNDFMSFTQSNYNKDDTSMVQLRKLSLEKAEEYAKEAPFDVRFFIYIAASYSKEGLNLKDEEALMKGEEYFKKMLVYTPNRPDVNYGLALNLFYQKKYDESFLYFEKSFSLNTNFFNFDLSSDYTKEESQNVKSIYTVFFKYFYDTKNKENFIQTAKRLRDSKYISEAMFTQITDYIEKHNSFPFINFTS